MEDAVSPKLPLEILFRILDRAFDESANWDISRQYLPLRLVSSWFGSYLEKALLSHTYVDIDCQPCSASDQLHALLQTNTKLAGNVRNLTVTDHKVLCELDRVEAEVGTPAWHAYREMLVKRTAMQHEYLRSLLKVCSELRGLTILSWWSCIVKPPNSIFPSGSSKLQLVGLQGEAVATYLPDFVHTGRRDLALLISPPTFVPQGAETPETLTLRLASDWTLPPYDLDHLFLMHSPINFTTLFLARVPFRPRSLYLHVETCERVSDLVDALTVGPCFKSLHYVGFRPGLQTADRGYTAIDIAKELRRLEDASPVGLRATWGSN